MARPWLGPVIPQLRFASAGQHGHVAYAEHRRVQGQGGSPDHYRHRKRKHRQASRVFSQPTDRRRYPRDQDLAASLVAAHGESADLTFPTVDHRRTFPIRAEQFHVFGN